MENSRQKQINRLKLTRTIDNKRTISSEQGHYHRSQHQRKYTIQYETKKSIRQPLMQRKSQSLPRNLANSSQPVLHPSIRSRKLIYSSNNNVNDQKSSIVTAPTHHNINMSTIQGPYQSTSGNAHRVDLSKNKLFNQALQQYEKQKYRNAAQKFEEVYRQVQGKIGYEKLLYYMGLAYWFDGAIEKAAIYLLKALDQGYEFSTQTYEMLSTFYEATKNYNCALKTLDCWLKSESSSKAHLMRARIYFIFKQYEKAISDYMQCYRIQPTKLQAYIQQADTTYRLLGLEASLTKYNNLLLSYPKIWPTSKHSDINYVKYKKSLLLVQQKQYPQALSILTQIQTLQLKSQVNYYKGIIYTILGELDNALLSFRESVEANTSEKFVGQSYYEKFVLMFKKNEYYAIQYQFDRIGDKYQDNQGLRVLRIVTEGIICVLKMNFSEGLKIFSTLSSNPTYQKCQKLYQHTVTSFKIFSLYSLHSFNQAFQQFTNLKNKRLSQSNNYNYILLKAIRAANSNDYHQALAMFQEAQKIQPFNTHTFMVKAIVQIMFYRELGRGEIMGREDEANQEILLSAQELLNRCLLKENQNDQLLYILAAINYELGQYQSGRKLIRKAIQSSDDHTIKHYYLKANLKIMLQMYEQSVNDYTNAILVINEQEQNLQTTQAQISINSSGIATDKVEPSQKDNSLAGDKQQIIYECFLERAKCYILDGNLEKAQADLRRFFSQLENVKKYEDELQLFMHVGCSDVILDIYKSILQQQYNPYQKMKCFYLSKQLNNCLNMMNFMLEYNNEEDSETESLGSQKYDKEKLLIDRDCLDALKKSSQGSTLLIQQALNVFENKIQKGQEGDIFKKSDCIFYAGVMSFHLQQYPKAKNYFIDSKAYKLQSGQISLKPQDSLSSTMTPQNKIYTLQQINYNIAICDLMQQKWNPYLQQYDEFKKYHQAVSQNLKNQSFQQPQQITPFVVKNRLCSIYPPEKLGHCVCFRLSFCLPKIKLREVKFRKNMGIIGGIGFKDIDMRPSAPWIQKNKKGIVFTTDGLKESIDLKSEKSKKNINNNVKKKAEERYKEIDN